MEQGQDDGFAGAGGRRDGLGVAGGGCTYCSTGSATAKNRISVPMPAAKSMAVQAKVEKSGVELSGPRRMRPKREKARPRMKTSAAVMSRM